MDDVGVTVVRFANGVEAWLKPTDFKNDQVLFSLNAPGGTSLAPPADYPEASLATALVSSAGAGGLKALDLQKVLTGKLVSARPYIGLSSQGLSGSAAPAQLETALQLLYQEFTAPGDDAESFALLKKQLAAAVSNRGRAPRQDLRREAAADQLLGTLHVAAADAGAGRDAEPREDDRVLQGALRQRRRLLVLHGRRLQGRRGDPAAGAVCRLAALHRQADIAVQGRRRSTSPKGRSRRKSRPGASRAGRR